MEREGGDIDKYRDIGADRDRDTDGGADRDTDKALTLPFNIFIVFEISTVGTVPANSPVVMCSRGAGD